MNRDSHKLVIQLVVNQFAWFVYWLDAGNKILAGSSIFSYSDNKL